MPHTLVKHAQVTVLTIQDLQLLHADAIMQPQVEHRLNGLSIQESSGTKLKSLVGAIAFLVESHVLSAHDYVPSSSNKEMIQHNQVSGIHSLNL